MIVADLYVLPTKAQLVDLYLANLTASGCLATDWYIGSVQRTMIEQTETTCALDLTNGMLEVAKQNWIDDASSDWLTDLAHQVWEIDRAPGTFAVQSVTLMLTAGFPSVVIASGEDFVAGDGKAYTADSGGSISGGGTLTITATATQVGPAQGLISRLLYPKPGLAVTAASIATVATIKRYGASVESDASLRARCLARWPSLDAVATVPRYVKWALASTTEITRVKLATTAFPNEVLITLASASGAVSGPGMTTATAYIMARRPIGPRLTIQSATNAAIGALGVVWVPRGTLAAVQAAAQTAWAAYLGMVGIGTKIILEKLVAIVRDAGAIDIQSVYLGLYGGTPVPADYVLGSTEVPILPGAAPTLATQLNWYEI